MRVMRLGLLAVLMLAAAALITAAAAPLAPDAETPPFRRLARHTPPREVKLGPGVFLVASRRITDPKFASTVVLLLRHGPTGAVGLVVNRPTNVDVASVLPDLEPIDPRDGRVHYGGPVQPAQTLFLVLASEPPPKSVRVFGPIHVIWSRLVVGEALEPRDPGRRVRVYSGYAGWAPGQLEAEVAGGGWRVVTADAAEVFDPLPGELWKRLFDSLSGLWARLPTSGRGAPAPSPARAGHPAA